MWSPVQEPESRSQEPGVEIQNPGASNSEFGRVCRLIGRVNFDLMGVVANLFFGWGELWLD